MFKYAFSLCWGNHQAKMLICAVLGSTLAWRIPWTEEPGRLQSVGSLRVGHDWATSLSCIGEGNGNPLQCFCLENPSDGEAWWAAVYGVAQSWTRLKRLSSSSSRLKITLDTWQNKSDSVEEHTLRCFCGLIQISWEGRLRSKCQWNNRQQEQTIPALSFQSVNYHLWTLAIMFKLSKK